jgi:hypothetical protein
MVKPNRVVMVYIISNYEPSRKIDVQYVVWDGKEVLYVSKFSENVIDKCQRMRWWVLNTVEISSALPTLPTVDEIIGDIEESIAESEDESEETEEEITEEDDE